VDHFPPSVPPTQSEPRPSGSGRRLRRSATLRWQTRHRPAANATATIAALAPPQKTRPGGTGGLSPVLTSRTNDITHRSNGWVRAMQAQQSIYIAYTFIDKIGKGMKRGTLLVNDCLVKMGGHFLIMCRVTIAGSSVGLTTELLKILFGTGDRFRILDRLRFPTFENLRDRTPQCLQESRPRVPEPESGCTIYLLPWKV